MVKIELLLVLGGVVYKEFDILEICCRFIIMQTFISHSEEETIKIGETLAKKFKKGTVIALYGEFGAGKTVLVRGMAKTLKCSGTVKSPSFVFMLKYDGKIPLYHIDLYRVKNPDDIKALGLIDFIQGDGVCVIEWAEKAGKELPVVRINIKIEVLDDNARKLEIEEVYP